MDNDRPSMHASFHSVGDVKADGSYSSCTSVISFSLQWTVRLKHHHHQNTHKIQYVNKNTDQKNKDENTMWRGRRHAWWWYGVQ